MRALDTTPNVSHGLAAMLLALLALVAFAHPRPAQAEVPLQANFQGLLLDPNGVAINGTVDVGLRVWADPGSIDPADLLYEEEHAGVQVVDGVFNVPLGGGAVVSGTFGIGTFNEAGRWLEVEIDTEVLTPRQAFLSAPFSLRAGDADALEGMGSAEFAPASHGHSFAGLSGTASDGQVPDDITINYAATAGNAAAAGNADTVDGQHASAFADSAHNHAGSDITSGTVADARIAATIARDSEIMSTVLAGDGPGSGLNADRIDGLDSSAFLSVASDYGRSGVASQLYEGTTSLTDKYVNWSGDDMSGRLTVSVATLGEVWNEALKATHTSSTYGAGVFGLADGTEAHGVHGGATGSSGSGLFGEAIGGYGIGAYGFSTGVYGKGLYGEATGTFGEGLYAKHTNSGNDGRIGSAWEGVRGYSPTGGRGVLGVSVGGEGVGGSTSGSGNGVRGSNSTSGDYGALGGSGYGVYGEAGSGSSNAGVFRGNVVIQALGTGTTVLELGEGLDYAEGFAVSRHDEIGAGAVLVIDPDNAGKLKLSSEPYDRRVAGIVAGANGLGSGVSLGSDLFDHDVALAGRVYCNVDATYGEVSPGDLLTTAPTPGYAMVVKDHARARGAILGKAMEPLPRGARGQVLVLVTLQ
jgi:hypothetical protein